MGPVASSLSSLEQTVEGWPWEDCNCLLRLQRPPKRHAILRWLVLHVEWPTDLGICVTINTMDGDSVETQQQFRKWAKKAGYETWETSHPATLEGDRVGCYYFGDGDTAVKRLVTFIAEYDRDHAIDWAAILAEV